MIEQQTRLQHFIAVIRRADSIVTTTDEESLLGQILELIIEVTQAQAGMLYLRDTAGDGLRLRLVRGLRVREELLAQCFAVEQSVAEQVLRQRTPVFVGDVSHDLRWDVNIAAGSSLQVETLCCLPLVLNEQTVGVVEVFNMPQTFANDAEDMALVQLLCHRLTSEMEKMRLLAEAQRRERRQQALVDIIAHITTTLKRDQLLDRIMTYATNLLEVEATSIWLRDERTGDLVLQTATGSQSERVRKLRVPAGKGIIGYVTSTGERVLVSNVRNDQRFYNQIDQQSGFVTRSILCVPLRAQKIQLGGEEGEVEEMIIGGAQALNKCNGQPFSDEDISLFETLASQAATVLQLSRLYERNSRLFLGIIQAVTGAIDLKDPYTRGHSQRVADFSVAIAQELGLPQQMIYHVRIGGILHDVGKIGVSDTILKKPDHLTDAEMEEIKQHPLNGVRLLEAADLAELLREESAALAQHHERLDGRGYPLGLHGDQITQMGRIVAVADAFDAMTSTRPYRPGMPVEQALGILRHAAGTEYDAACVAALVRAWEHGLIRVQGECA